MNWFGKYSCSTVIDRWLLRHRLFFYCCPVVGHIAPPEVPAGFRMERFFVRDLLEDSTLNRWVPSALLQVGGKNISVVTYLVFPEGGGPPVGGASHLIVRSGNVWYDNVPLKPGEDRLVGLAVLPEYRGKGLGRFLQRQWFFDANNNPDVRLLSAIVEAHRVPSIRAQRAVFSHVTNNWLIKAAGRNVFSIVTGGEHKGAWYVGPGHNCRWRNNG